MRSLLILILTASFSAAQPLTLQPGSLFNLPEGFEDRGVHILTSTDTQFGGLSGLLIDPDGRLLAVADKGYLVWLEFAEGPLTSLGTLGAPTTARLQPLELASNHQPVSHRRDAESLAWLDRAGAPRLYISFERDHRIQRHLPDGNLDQRLPKPTALQGTFGNTGLEAVSDLPGTCLFAVTEGVRRQGGLRAYRYCGGATWPTRVYHPSAVGYAPTAADLSPDGRHVYLIERKFEGLRGFRAHLVRVPVAHISADRPLVPELVLDLSPHMMPTWNLEGLALTTDGNGRVIALMVSDNNYRSFLTTALIALALPQAGS